MVEYIINIPNIKNMPRNIVGNFDSFPCEKIVEHYLTKERFVFRIEGILSYPVFTFNSISEKKCIETWKINNDQEAKWLFWNFIKINPSFDIIK